MYETPPPHLISSRTLSAYVWGAYAREGWWCGVALHVADLTSIPSLLCRRFFRRTSIGGHQTVLSNGFGELASWGISLPAASGSSGADDISVFVGQDVSLCWFCPFAVQKAYEMGFC